MRRQIKGLKRWIERLTRRLSNSWVGRLAIGGWQWTISLPNSTAFWLALVGVVLLGSILGLVFGGWDWFRPQPSEGQSTVTAESRSTTIRNVGLVIGGVVALVFAVWRGVVAHRQAVTAERQAETALRQSETAEQGLLNERYQKGAEMLGSEVLAVRLGGIYALQRLAEEHPEQYHIQIMQLFCAFVRNPAGEAEGPVWRTDRNGDLIRGLREDVQAVMNAIGKRGNVGIDLEFGPEDFRLDLTNANLQHGMFQELDLSGAFLMSAKLPGAYLGRSDLSGAFLDDACLRGARFPNANLTGVSFADAKLTDASLVDANLTGASFSVREINGGYISPAKGLTQAQLDEARSDPEDPPMLNGVLDAENGEQLVWQGKPLDDDP